MLYPEWTALRRLMFVKAASGETLVEQTATGNPATFSTTVAKPLKQLLIPFTPVQSGSGDPSPSNVRPITGWTGVNVSRTGINLFNGMLENGTIDSSGNKTGSSSSTIRTADYIPCAPNTEYYIYYVKAGNGSNMKIYYYDKNKNYISNRWTDSSKRTTPENAQYIMFYMDSAYTSESSRNIGINYPSMETDFEPYHGTFLPVTFPAEAGTVYGGTLDAVTGTLTVTHWYKLFDGSEQWSGSDSGAYYRVLLGANNFDVLAKGDSSIVSNYLTDVRGVWQGWFSSTSNFLVYTDPTLITSAEDWKAYLAEHNLQLVYELDTPQTIQLDPVTVTTLVGTNTVWTDTNGTNTIKYMTGA